ncbi:pilus assembly protein [Dyella acidisoli]|uniref:Type IV fimbrial biogenesis PilY1 n=1 Tax=Dyella acidisoli TaxID=1867834 RepID=A0ABQ5XS92_9GAMM|nr:PilC/PilY family type IV pilus protein [Dyella acidisoli]GLQ94631.1 type IV fimbrial biogenesis PilY1 [Dyella acidisoli]
MSTFKRSISRLFGRTGSTAGAVLLVGMLNAPAPVWAATPPQLSISQTPIIVTQPVHPQVLIAIGNSESMDGDLSGAIMTGSGALSSSYTSLQSSSSPVNYSIPSGFNPSQLGVGGSSCSAPAVSSTSSYPYTYTCSNTEYDVSASRLNVAKQSIYQILNQYFYSTDFGLMDYAENSPSLYQTWVYYMSDSSNGFTFSSTNTSPPTGDRYIANPCYNYSNASSQVKSDCGSIASGSWSNVNQQYLLIGASSDDASINDVLYASGRTSVSISYGGPNPSNPYTHYGISDYEKGGITTSYSNSTPNFVTTTSPTNAGYIPFSPQVMYAMRGFGYGATDSQTGGSGQIVATDSSGNNIVSAGQSPTTTSVSTALGYFTSALNAETNSTSTKEIKALAGQSPLAGLMKSALSTLKNVTAPSYDCTQPHKYVILITDGLPTEDLSGNFWPPLGSASATGYGVTASFNSNGSLNTNYTPPSGKVNDQALIDTVNQITALNNAGILTYVVGMGAGADPSNSSNSSAVQALAAMAIAGGTSSVSTNGYLPATSPQALVSDLASILNDIASRNNSISEVAANSTSLSTNTLFYQASFNPGSATTDAWTGDLDAYSASGGTIDTSLATWDAQSLLDSQSTRYIATWDPYHVPTGGTTVTPAGVAFQWTSLSTNLQTVLNSTDSLGQQRLGWLRGSNTYYQSNGGTLRTRQHVLGDIIDSAPYYVGPPSDYFPDASYQTFVTNNASRTPMIYVGANDGMLHGFNASTGSEQMAFVPYGVFANLPLLTSPSYLYNHHFFVDGTPYADDVMLSDGNWHTLLVGGENAGGNSIYAIDVTNPSNFSSDSNVASAVKWEYTDSGMGYSYSSPTIVRSNAVTVTDATSGATVQGFAVLFGNGYNSPSGQPIFYAVNASTGALLAKINLCTATGVPTTACSSSAANGLSSITAVNSSGVSGIPQDMAYAGDLQGNVWAINMSNSTPSSWTVKLLFQARDGSGNAQPITSAPTVAPNPNFPSLNGQTYLGSMVYFGTGLFLQTSDLTSTNTQSFYGVWDNSSDLSNYASPPTLPYTRSNLEAQTLSTGTYTSSSGTTTQVVYSTNNPVNLTYASETINNSSGTAVTYPSVEGWYFDLSPLASATGAPAPRVFTNSELLYGGILFTVNIPPYSTSTSCGLPLSYLMYVNYATGGPFSRPALSYSSTITSSSSYQSSSGAYATGVAINNGYSSASISLGNSLGSTGNYQGCGYQHVCTTYTPIGPGTRASWWQIK